jgi:lipid A 3-O-deacylase
VRPRAKALLVLLLALLLGRPPRAEPAGLAVSAGAFDVLRGAGRPEAGLERRSAPRRFHPLPRFVPDLVPLVGAMATAKGSAYGYGGFRLDVPLAADGRWTLSPGFAAGLYARGDGKNLGGPIEFRSSIELSRRLGGGRLGLLLYHLSNAGIYRINGGSESLVLSYGCGPGGGPRP